ncbi:MAG TPA: M23 family metallopeptidase [Desulfuromonadales bacterium]|nr:M23 family metallopeptidase [Desulfuromonadales bacterium]
MDSDSIVPFRFLYRAAFVLIAGLMQLCIFPSQGVADIYRFVTVDGVETFTDAPRVKEAKMIIKDRPAPSSKRRGGQQPRKSQKVHDISLEEIVQKTVLAASNPNATSPEPFEPHLPGVGGTVTSLVGMRIDPIDGVWRQHNGVDIAIPTGTAVMPVAAGVVIYCGARSGYGNTVIVEHDNGIVTLYAHNSQILVSQGQPVTAGSTLALSGSTGRSTGPHLHFEAWQAGTNITDAFVPGSTRKLSDLRLVAATQRSSRFRSEVLSDGSVLFTNLPASRP